MARKMAIMKVINDFEVVLGGQTSQFGRNPQWQNERGSQQFNGASASQTEAQLYVGQITKMAWRTFSDSVPAAEPTAYSYAGLPTLPIVAQASRFLMLISASTIFSSSHYDVNNK
jgi:hypothetical protein